MEKMPRLEMLNRMGVEMELQKSHEKLADYIIISPEERYLNLLETRPDLLERVPQYQVGKLSGHHARILEPHSKADYGEMPP
jgi:hypothetical protein